MVSSNIDGGTATKGESAMEGGGAAKALSPDAGTFSEGEKVLAYHDIHIYEAKIQKTELRKDEWKYFVHYLGWNKNWDEWVGTDRLLKYTDENIRTQQELAKNHSADKHLRSGRSTQNKPKSSNDAKVDKEDPRNNAVKGKKRKSQSGIEEKETGPHEKLVLLQFPSALKKQLVDDWEFVTQLGKLVKVPRSPSVDDILKKYLDYRTKKDGMVAESVAEILKGLRCYFDRALPAMLLYKKERSQFHASVTENVSPSTIYGAEHLLRLFVKLPELLAYVNMEEEALAKLQKKLLDFLRFLQKNQSSFFLSTYDGSKGMDDADDKPKKSMEASKRWKQCKRDEKKKSQKSRAKLKTLDGDKEDEDQSNEDDENLSNTTRRKRGSLVGNVSCSINTSL